MIFHRLVVCLAVLASPAFAAFGALDDAPAATLLVPYFEVDLASATGRTTVVQVRAASASAVLAHVTLWTDQGVPVFGFDTYFTGYDSVTFDVRDLLAGTLPRTASAGQDPSNTISVKGPRSQDINFASCTGLLPAAAVPALTLAELKLALTGKASALLQGQCGGHDRQDNVARGFITVDSTNSCTTLMPGSTGYFVAGGAGVANNRNELTGHFQLIDPAARTTRALAAVHLEASSGSTFPAAASFYGRLLGSTADQREPLAYMWHAPWRRGDSLLVWRDVDWSLTPYACGQPRTTAPLGQRSLWQWDTQEGTDDLTALSPFDTGASLVTVGSAALPARARAGFFIFNGTLAVQTGQSWVATFGAAEQGRFVAGVRGAPLDSATYPDASNESPNLGSTGIVTSVRALDFAPAATLLLPHFEVSLDDPNQSNTIARITNTVADAVLVNVTLWTDLGVPTRNFPLYLTGFDQAELDLRLLFARGLLSRTATAGQDPGDLISPRGPFSQDINFASCSGLIPQAALKAGPLAALQLAHTGRASPLFAGKCAGSTRTDNVARGYLTFDLVNTCRPGFPTGAGYASSLDSRNTLVGDFMLTNRTARTVLAEALVPVHARPPSHPLFAAGQPRFYGRYTAHQEVNREALPSHYEVPFDQTGTGKTSLVVWREPDLAAAPFTCGQAPAGQPGDASELLAFDEEENVTALSGAPFPAASTRVELGANGLAVPYQRGFLQLDLDNAGPSGGPLGQLNRRQAFVLALRSDPQGTNGWVQNGHPTAFSYPRALVEASEVSGYASFSPSASAKFTVRLNSIPTDDVTVPLSGPANVTLTPGSVVLTSSNALTGVEVTVSMTSSQGAPFDLLVSLGAATSLDARFAGFNAVDVAVPSR